MPPDTRSLVDRVLDGHLNAYLTDLRAQGCSFETIARKLSADHDISVTGETIRNWLKEPA